MCILKISFCLPSSLGIDVTRVNFFLGGGIQQIQCVYILFIECGTLIISEIIVIFEGASQIFGERAKPPPSPYLIALMSLGTVKMLWFYTLKMVLITILC